MSRFKDSFNQFIKDPIKWRQDSWDRTSDKQAKILNILLKLSSGTLTALCFLLVFIGKKEYLILGIISLIILITFNPIRFKAKYGSKK
ncbi:hypothetical protein [Romboutsia ilealis]|uniref:hypothetical protein n=1 Tax=Romboutsia ilealis TaxID=1115758 RepID=UPI00272D605F|nr:hypothetical protein [Romboutsia ilealis]